MSQDKPGPDAEVTDGEIAERLLKRDVPIITTKELAEQGDITMTAARNRLERLVKEGALRRKETGKGVVYYPDCYDPES
jgi:FaeA-like protein.